ncbi:hypothetical protein L0668_12065 [Paraglaciecola aquimarina]|uniref:Peptidase M56 domain-containing protein n=1 Tax=Paraglaciecola algarum TaxID=3050085 RepID=A0ABS9D7J3_9ALTE|nr:M56 family metallopeptidase [Paraglaciecola sp. G1-23]MCF2948846.1 hypothetical protein [Paraglaciecola sp. G1-23]
MDYILTNIFITLIMLATVKLISQSPARLQLTLLMLAVISWFIPWHKIEFLRIYSQDLFTKTIENLFPQINEYLQTNKLDTPLSLNAPAAPTLLENIQQTFYSPYFEYSLIIMSCIGLAWLVVDISRYQLYLSKLNNSAKEKNSLLEQQYFSSTITFRRKLTLKTSPLVPTAMATGTFKPTIWLNQETVNSPQIHSILLHEITHLQQLDPTLKWLILLIKRLFWWNSLVQILLKKIDLLIEMRCDQHCFSVKQEKYSVDLAEIILNHHKKSQALDIKVSWLTSITSQSNANMARITSLKIEKTMKARFVTLAIFGVLLSSMVCTQINSISIDSVSTNSVQLQNTQKLDLNAMELNLQTHRAKLKKFKIYLAETEVNTDYNRQINQLVSLSKDALNSDKNVVDNIFNEIETWVAKRAQLNQNQENKLMFHTFAVQNFLLQQQGKSEQIIDLLVNRFGSLDRLPKAYLNRAATALLQQQQPEKATQVLNQFNFNDPRIAIGNIYLAVEAYMLGGEYEQALQLLEDRLNRDSGRDTQRLLTLKYQVLNYIGSSKEANQIKQSLANYHNIHKVRHRDFSVPQLRVHWAPVLDYI